MSFSEHAITERLVRVETKLNQLGFALKDQKEDFEKKLTEAIQAQVASEMELKTSLDKTNLTLGEIRDKMVLIRFIMAAMASVALVLLGAFAKGLFDHLWK